MALINENSTVVNAEVDTALNELISMFPEVDAETLSFILAHNLNSLEDTVLYLIDETGTTDADASRDEQIQDADAQLARALQNEMNEQGLEESRSHLFSRTPRTSPVPTPTAPVDLKVTAAHMAVKLADVKKKITENLTRLRSRSGGSTSGQLHARLLDVDDSSSAINNLPAEPPPDPDKRLDLLPLNAAAVGGVQHLEAQAMPYAAVPSVVPATISSTYNEPVVLPTGIGDFGGTATHTIGPSMEKYNSRLNRARMANASRYAAVVSAA